MTRIISIHEYELGAGVGGERFESAILGARNRGVLQIDGLSEHRFLRGIRGASRGKYGALWIYESRRAWEGLWGTTDRPLGVADYPPSWRSWEGEVLAPLLAGDPDKIRFTAYEEF